MRDSFMRFCHSMLRVRVRPETLVWLRNLAELFANRFLKTSRLMHLLYMLSKADEVQGMKSALL